MNSIPTVGIVLIKANKILLVREGEKSGHITGMYNTPAGRIEKNETPLQAAIRELEEETGLQTKETDLFELPKKYEADIPRKNGEVLHFYHTVFICKSFTGELKSSDDVQPEWVEIDHISNYNLLPNVADMIDEGRKYL